MKLDLIPRWILLAIAVGSVIFAAGGVVARAQRSPARLDAVEAAVHRHDITLERIETQLRAQCQQLTRMEEKLDRLGR